MQIRLIKPSQQSTANQPSEPQQKKLREELEEIRQRKETSDPRAQWHRLFAEES